MINICLGYVKVATFLKGFKRVQVDELAPSSNMIAISAEDEKTFYLNGQQYVYFTPYLENGL